MKIVVFGTSGERGLAAASNGFVRELEARGHDVLVLRPAERPARERRRKPRLLARNTRVFRSVSDLKTRYAPRVRAADVVIVGSRLPWSADVGQWVTRVARGVTAYYDSDPPPGMTRLEGAPPRLASPATPKYDVYFPGGRTAADFERFVAEAMTGQLMA